MSPLKVEVSRTGTEWVQAGPLIKPGDPSGSMSNNKEDGSRELYFFECSPDDSRSTIYKSGAGFDVDLGLLRASEIDTSRLEVIRELLKGETYEMEVKTDRSLEKIKVRFTHQ